MALSRKIKCYNNPIQPNEYYIHPITLEIVKNKYIKPICPSELHFTEKGQAVHYTVHYDKTINYSKQDIQTFMALPYVNFNIDMILKIYKIDTIDSIIAWIEKTIEEKTEFDTINRILNLWIHKHFDELKKNHAIIVVIVNKLINKYLDISINDTDERIKKWFEHKDINDFNFNLILELNI